MTDHDECPTPGSDHARSHGCKCPQADNRFGLGMPYPDGPRFVTRDDCPLHGKDVKR
jgi:hypothetical protein